MAGTAAGRARPVTGRPSPLRMLWITAALAVCFLGIQWGLRDAPLLWFAALRALLGGAALAIVALWQRRPWPSSVSAWGKISVLGVVNVSVAFAAMFAGVAGLATGIAAVLANAQPLLILLPAWWLFGERMIRPRIGSASVGRRNHAPSISIAQLGHCLCANPLHGGGRSARTGLHLPGQVTLMIPIIPRSSWSSM